MNVLKRFFHFIHTLLFLKSIFSRNFHLITGETVKNAAASLRHKVFCDEQKWEPIQKSGLEQDSYDTHSLPIVLYVRGSKLPIACVRLIFAKNYNPLPMEKSLILVDRGKGLVKIGLTNDRHRSAEVSRLAVDPDFRKRQSEKGKVFTEGTIDPLHGRFPFIAVGIYLAMIRSASLKNIEHLYFLINPALFRSLKKLGANPIVVGEKVEHKGERVPCYISVSEMIQNLPWWSRPVWKVICKQIDQGPTDSYVPLDPSLHSII